MKLTVELTDFQHEKLVKLASAKKCSIEECIQAFATTCQPGGSGWKEPFVAASEHYAKKASEDVEDAVVPSSTL